MTEAVSRAARAAGMAWLMPERTAGAGYAGPSVIWARATLPVARSGLELICAQS